eukprot:TRINITY_DN682_c1_g1_i9.p4 TRINITY_DN682_c1_g1~~TRINITY_DN682_c1_g1_i9.p4  ORF type:complete len:128 (-),score=11.22 TRINITY_DN682_c1_g1_i9:20-403(-)
MTLLSGAVAGEFDGPIDLFAYHVVEGLFEEVETVKQALSPSMWANFKSRRRFRRLWCVLFINTHVCATTNNLTLKLSGNHSLAALPEYESDGVHKYCDMYGYCLSHVFCLPSPLGSSHDQHCERAYH